MNETASAFPVGFVVRIPVRNLWLLMLYSGQAELDGRGLGGREKPDAHLPDVLAALITRELELRLRRQRSVSYQVRESTLTRARGRIDVVKTERRHLLRRGLIACTFSDLTRDSVRNRYVRAALQMLALHARPELAATCRALALRMDKKRRERRGAKPGADRGGPHGTS